MHYHTNHHLEEEEEEEEESVLESIVQTKKRRKFLSSSKTLPSKHQRRRFFKSTKEDDDDDEEGDDTTEMMMEGNKDLSERLHSTFSGGGDGAGNDDEKGGGMGILGKKHRAAMEEFIAANMATSSSTADASADAMEATKKLSDEEALYAELAHKASSILSQPSTNEQPTDTTQEGDVGAGGAMLGGTGIAEVALPVNERLRNVQNTEMAALHKNQLYHSAAFSSSAQPTQSSLYASSHQMSEQDLAEMLPTSFAKGPAILKSTSIPSSSSTPISSLPTTIPLTSSTSIHIPSTSTSANPSSSIQKTDVSHLGASYSHNFKLHTAEWITSKKKQQQQEEYVTQLQQRQEKEILEGTTVVGKERMGFEMKRKILKGEMIGSAGATASNSTSLVGSSRGGSGGAGGREGGRNGSARANDDRVLKNFITGHRGRWSRG
mmetsp:Transcript_58121/g.86394  ORF Transcript_58121/g.86394 Transcript_58121/m.86394 type:complete len:435 (-) Transcript_58121:7-1311(-)